MVIGLPRRLLAEMRSRRSVTIVRKAVIRRVAGLPELRVPLWPSEPATRVRLATVAAMLTWKSVLALPT